MSVANLSNALADRYRVERELGTGGMATVYLAYDLRHDRPVALKVLKPELAAVIDGERFLAEIKTTANLQHPHILPLFDSGQVDGTVSSCSSAPAPRRKRSSCTTGVGSCGRKQRDGNDQWNARRWRDSPTRLLCANAEPHRRRPRRSPDRNSSPSRPFARRRCRAQSPDWTEPFPPFHIAGNLYYVGSKGLANFLITTPQGHILINSDLEANVPLIKASVEQLGFKFSDVKILLISHAHWDHDAGSAAVKAATGAAYMVMDADVPVVESGGKADFNYGSDPAHALSAGQGRSRAARRRPGQAGRRDVWSRT